MIYDCLVVAVISNRFRFQRPPRLCDPSKTEMILFDTSNVAVAIPLRWVDVGWRGWAPDAVPVPEVVCLDVVDVIFDIGGGPAERGAVVTYDRALI